MLIVDYDEHGRTTVRFKKDWHAGRIGRAYVTKPYQQPPANGTARLQQVALDKTLRTCLRRIKLDTVKG